MMSLRENNIFVLLLNLEQIVLLYAFYGLANKIMVLTRSRSSLSLEKS